MEQTDPRTGRTPALLHAWPLRIICITSLPASVRQAAPKKTETLAGVNPPLDGPVVLLQDIIEVRRRPVLAAGVQRSFILS
jgi:hypothetical protein